jgi:hypothetical protein
MLFIGIFERRDLKLHFPYLSNTSANCSMISNSITKWYISANLNVSNSQNLTPLTYYFKEIKVCKGKPTGGKSG